MAIDVFFGDKKITPDLHSIMRKGYMVHSAAEINRCNIYTSWKEDRTSYQWTMWQQFHPILRTVFSLFNKHLGNLPVLGSLILG